MPPDGPQPLEWFGLVWVFGVRIFRKVVSGERRRKRFRVMPRRRFGSYWRVKLRNLWVRIEVSRELCFERVEKVFFLSCIVHVGLWSCFGMLSCLGMWDGDDEPSSLGKAEELTHSLRAVRGLPSPGKEQALIRLS